MLSIGEAAKVLFANLTVQSPVGRELSMPLSANPIADGVVVVAGILEFFRVIAVRLAGAQGSGDRQHRAALLPEGFDRLIHLWLIRVHRVREGKASFRR